MNGNVEIPTSTELRRFKGIGGILSFSNIVMNKEISQTTAIAISEVVVKVMKISNLR